jgi:spore coat protein U-like protein
VLGFAAADMENRMAMKLRYLLVLALLAAPATANAGLSCSASTSPVNFGSILQTETGTYDGIGTITVTCSGSQGAAIAACIDITAGDVNAANQRLISLGNTTIAMQLFQDSARSIPWGSAWGPLPAPLQRTGDGPMTATVYARLYSQSGSIAGLYSANYTVNTTIGTAGLGSCSTLH